MLQSQKLARTRTRSAKGAALDELQSTKSKVSQRIIFDKDGAQVNNNANVKVTTLRNKNCHKEKEKVDRVVPRNRNLTFEKQVDVKLQKWVKENRSGKLSAEKIRPSGQRERKALTVDVSQLQGETEKNNKKDGVVLDVDGIDGIEELDYVDDLLEHDELSEFKEEVSVIDNRNNRVTKDKNNDKLPVATNMAASTSGNKVPMNVSTERHHGAAASNGESSAEKLTDEELVNMPRVKNLFNKKLGRENVGIEKG